MQPKIVGWRVGWSDESPAMYNLDQHDEAFAASLKCNRPISALMVRNVHVTPSAARGMLRWLQSCADLGWPNHCTSDLADLWWKYHDDEGNLYQPGVIRTEGCGLQGVSEETGMALQRAEGLFPACSSPTAGEGLPK